MRLLSLAAITGFLAISSLQAEVVNGVVAIVNDKIITHGDVWKDLEPQMEGLMRRYGRDQSAFDQKLKEKEAELIERLVERYLILNEFKTAGYILPDSALDDIVQGEVRQRFGDRVTLTKTLQAEGKTFESFREEIRTRLIEAEMRRMNIDGDVIVSPHKIENYYVLNREKYRVGDQVKLRMISINPNSSTTAEQAKDVAVQVLGRVKAGSSFAEMAGVYSENSKKTLGGDYGWVERNFLMKPLTDAAFTLDAKQMTPVIGIARPEPDVTVAFFYDDKGAVTKTRRYSKDAPFVEAAGAPSGQSAPQEFYILLVEEKRVAFSKPLAEVRDEIEKNLQLEERERIRKRWMEKLKKKSFVRYFE